MFTGIGNAQTKRPRIWGGGKLVLGVEGNQPRIQTKCSSIRSPFLSDRTAEGQTMDVMVGGGRKHDPESSSAH